MAGAVALHVMKTYENSFFYKAKNPQTTKNPCNFYANILVALFF